MMDPDTVPPSLYGSIYGRGIDLNLSLDSLEDSDTDSLSEERKYQSELQNWISNNEETVFQTTEGSSHGDPKLGDTEVQGTSPPDERTAHWDSRSQDTPSTYSELRYDPNWRRHQILLNTSPPHDEDLLDVSFSFSGRLSPDEILLNKSAEREELITVPQNPEPLSDVPPKPKRNPATMKPVHSKGARNDEWHLDVNKARSLAQQEAAQNDFIEKNKVTLGVRSHKSHSYLHMHRRKADESKSDQGSGKSNSASQPVTEMKHNAHDIPGTTEVGFPNNNVKQTVSISTNMANTSTGTDVTQQERTGFSSGPPANECPAAATYPHRHVYSPGVPKDVYLSAEEPQVQRKASLHPHIISQRLYHDRNTNEKLETVRDTWDHCSYSGLSQTDVQALQEPSVPSSVKCIADHYISMPNQIIQPKKTPYEGYDLQAATDSSLSDKSECDGGLRHSGVIQNQMIKNTQMDEKHQKMLIGYLKQEVKLGGIGPTYTMSQEKKEQLRQQKEYAKLIQERNRSRPIKAREMPVVQNEKHQGKRQKSLEYAKKVPRPQPSPKAPDEMRAEVPERRAMSHDSLFPQIKLLEELQARHEKEKAAVASLRALHIK
ncbi:jhy protein homolog [Pseudophryne corroboree]|uniref:jhy protein homolog n=1 Tax=Pseudophryne corroboree TaxID=495146 RepID=UPI0030813B12